ncbi:hypothetical protein AURDEDRAFT_167380 [Auricularia subglabra TFB-10046 SS5]|nr:hypothetical protein AURDEDRAFT_167380 [Auricularia subglabra TFB-10046 SS5]
MLFTERVDMLSITCYDLVDVCIVFMHVTAIQHVLPELALIADSGRGRLERVAIQSLWTHGLAIMPIVSTSSSPCAVPSPAFPPSTCSAAECSRRVSFLAALLMLIAFICGIWLTAKLDSVEPHTNAGAGFQPTLTAHILLQYLLKFGGSSRSRSPLRSLPSRR